MHAYVHAHTHAPPPPPPPPHHTRTHTSSHLGPRLSGLSLVSMLLLQYKREQYSVTTKILNAEMHIYIFVCNISTVSLHTYIHIVVNGATKKLFLHTHSVQHMYSQENVPFQRL